MSMVDGVPPPMMGNGELCEEKPGWILESSSRRSLVDETERTMNTTHQVNKDYTPVSTSSTSISTSVRTGVYGSGVGVSIRSARDLTSSCTFTSYLVIHDFM